MLLERVTKTCLWMKKGNSLTLPFFKKYQTANAANICSFFICGKVKQKKLTTKFFS
jgi:hypothetical protein